MHDSAFYWILAATIALSALLFLVAYFVAVSMRVSVKFPRWVPLLLGMLFLANFSFFTVFHAIDVRLQNPRPAFHAWRHPGLVHFILVFGGSTLGCILGGIRAMRSAKQAHAQL